MTTEELNERHAAVIRRHSRVLTDMDGQPNPMLLAELAAVANDHARSERRITDRTTDRASDSKRVARAKPE